VGLNYSSEGCNNLTGLSSQAEKITVQESMNNLLMKSQFISSAPAVIFSVVAGGNLIIEQDQVQTIF
jgi:hypothetical protein